MKPLYLITTILILIFNYSCTINDTNDTKNTKNIKKYSGVPIPQTKFYTAMKELDKNQSVMFEVGSDSCKSCKDMAIMLGEIKEDYPKFKTYFIDVGKERVASKELRIKLIPTQIFFDKDGNEIFRHIGKYKNKELLIQKLKSLGFKL